ncbi:MAG: photosystem II protein PsbQ [Cyanobacteriota bacterium]|jgi:photosystem II protein PsbQ|nr:photosystem II protein PsbQ [Cyanobacteriota bacterium]
MSPLLPALQQLLRRVALLVLAGVLCFGLSACSGGKAKVPSYSPEDIAYIERQAEGFLAARDRLPELAALVNAKDWTFTRNLIHGPMQEVGRQMLYINKRLLPAERPEAEKLAIQLKTAMAQLDEAARLQDANQLQKAYIAVASGFGKYAQVFPAQVQADLKQA